MSNATTLYAVRLTSLQSAMGSKDESLLEKALAATRPEPVAKGPRATLTFLNEGGILFDDAPMSAEALRAELARPEQSGIRLRCIERRTGNPMRKAELSAAELAVIRDAMIAGIVTGWDWETPLEDHSEEFSLEQAIADLISGDRNCPDEDNTYQYGYALEKICHALGRHLGTIEGDFLLKHLKLKTPLSRRRKPVKLPPKDDVPEISYLTEDEVLAENQRLRETDLAYPKSDEIESGRREYATHVAAAAEEGLAIVAFSY